MSRISRGFHRLAVVTAAPIALAALISTGTQLQERYEALERERDRAERAEFVRNGPWKKDPIVEPGPWTKYQPVDQNPFADLVPQPVKPLYKYLAMPALLLATAAAAYAAIRSIGWIIDGFSAGQK